MMTIDSIPVSNFGMALIKSQGEFNFPKIKRPLSRVWQDKDGIDIDLTTLNREPREISLEFILQANSQSQYSDYVTGFQNLVLGAGLHDFFPSYLFSAIPAYVKDVIKVVRLTPMNYDIITAKISFTIVEPTYTVQN